MAGLDPATQQAARQARRNTDATSISVAKTRDDWVAGSRCACPAMTEMFGSGMQDLINGCTTPKGAKP